MMRTAPRLALFATAAFAAFAAPAAAQEGNADDPIGEGLDLFQRGADLFLRGLMDEIAPQLEQLRPRIEGLGEEIGPMIAGLLELIDEIDAYHPPERLPNGDIILRRKDPAERGPRPSDPPADGEVDI